MTLVVIIVRLSKWEVFKQKSTVEIDYRLQESVAKINRTEYVLVVDAGKHIIANTFILLGIV